MSTKLRIALGAVAVCGLVIATSLGLSSAEDTSPAGKTTEKQSACCEKCEAGKDAQAECATCCSTVRMKIGAVAYAPSAVTIFEGIRKYFKEHEFPIDYVLYSNYDALVAAPR